MSIITIELLNENALTLLQQLEKLNILRLVSSKVSTNNTPRKWAGSISKTTTANLLNQLNQNRNEWERNI